MVYYGELYQFSNISHQKIIITLSEKILVIIAIGVLYLLINIHTILNKLPGTLFIKPRFPLSLIPINIILKDIIIQVYPSLINLFQHK